MRFYNRITLQTPESVELEFDLAGIGGRALALLIDYHVLALTLAIFLVVWSFVAGQLVDLRVAMAGRADNLEGWVFAITLLVCFAIYVGYFVFFETLWRGQTPGKRWAKIRVIRDRGQSIGLQQATLRALLRPFDELFFLGAFLIMLGVKEKRLGDWVAGTLVVQEAHPASKLNLAVSETAQSLIEYLQTEAEVSQLLPDDFTVIREYLQRRDGMDGKARSDLSLKLAKQAKALIHLETVPSSITADQFLEAVYLTYQKEAEERKQVRSQSFASDL